MTKIISMWLGMMTARAATWATGSTYHRYCHSNPAMKHVATRIYPTAAASRFPNSNSAVQTIASRIYPMGRAFFDTTYKMIKSWLPKMPMLASFTYVSVEKVDGKEKIEQIVFPSLFRVTGKDILPDQKIYLFGTTHTFKVADYPPEALALINACGLLLSEFPTEMALSKNPYEWNLREEINSNLHVYKKLLSVDEEWINTLLAAYEPAAGKVDRSILFSKLKEKSRKIQADQVHWLSRLSLADQTKIQSRLNECGLQLRDLDPLLVSHFLSVINEQHFRNYDFNSIEVAILNNFQKRNCPIIELEDKFSDLSSSFNSRMQHIINYDLESTLEDIHWELEPIVDEPDQLTQALRNLQERAEKVVPLTLCEDKCVEFKTPEALRSQVSLIQEAHKLNMFRFLTDEKIYFNFDEYEKKWLADPEAADWTTIYRNKTFYSKIPVAIQQKKNTAVVCGAFHLAGKSGIIRSLRRDGYTVSHVKAL